MVPRAAPAAARLAVAHAAEEGMELRREEPPVDARAFRRLRTDVSRSFRSHFLPQVSARWVCLAGGGSRRLKRPLDWINERICRDRCKAVFLFGLMSASGTKRAPNELIAKS